MERVGWESIKDITVVLTITNGWYDFFPPIFPSEFTISIFAFDSFFQ